MEIMSNCLRNFENPVLPTTQSCAWRDILDKLPTYKKLLKIGVVSSINNYVFWIRYVEIINHMLITCKEASKVWYKCDQWTSIHSAHSDIFMEHFQSFELTEIGSMQNILSKIVWIGVVWNLWKSMNSVIFRGKVFKVNEVLSSV